MERSIGGPEQDYDDDLTTDSYLMDMGLLQPANIDDVLFQAREGDLEFFSVPLDIDA